MSGKEKKDADLEEKLKFLGSVTKSNAYMQGNKTSILVDASKYIRELKNKVDEAAAAASSKADSSSSMQVSVSSVELDSKSSSRRGFRINASMERTRPGLLVSVLEALEEVGLDVLDADVSCAADDTPFRFEAIGGSADHRQGTVDEQMVRQAVLQAIRKCMDDHNEDED